MILGIIKLPAAHPVEILTCIVMLVVFYASFVTQEFNIAMVSGGLLGSFLFFKGGIQK